MRTWNLTAQTPRSLTISADSRLSESDYFNDQIWELTLGGGEPAAMAVQTNYGLRARSCRLFPRFIEEDQVRMDPSRFFLPPQVHRFYPNFLLVSFSPYPNLDVEAEYWVPQSDAIAGRIRVTNRGLDSRQVRLEWAAALLPSEGGETMAPVELQAAPVLGGRTANLSPLVFLTGGAMAVNSPFPSLALGLDLPPGKTRQVVWCQAACSTREDSFNLARRIASRDWDAEIARIEIVNAGLIEVQTGNSDWDAAFALAQKEAVSLFLSPTEHLPESSFVSARTPDKGYSLRGDGSDYGYLWNGQTAMEAYFLADLLLPGSLDLIKGLLKNYLFTQAEDGSIDWKPGLGGQRGNLLAAPLLASLALRIHKVEGDTGFLEEVFPRLLAFFNAWFAPDNDRDGDGLPEWSHPMQTGFDENPIFSRWHDWARGVDITTTESPALCAFLYNECQSLIQIARLLEQPDPIPVLKEKAENLSRSVENAWDRKNACYQYWDRDSHITTGEKILGNRQGSGMIEIQQQFEQPVRLLLRVKSNGEATRKSQVFVHGSAPSGNHRVERISPERFQWFIGLGSVTSENTYQSVEQVEIQGLDVEDEATIFSLPLKALDHTLLLPLWAGIPTSKRAKSLVTRTITNPESFWRPFGIPACQYKSKQESSVCQQVHIQWNALIGRGLVKYGFRREAAELLSHLMEGILQTLKTEGGFRRYYQSETGQGIGEKNALGGLAPLGLFLDIIGVELISPFKVALAGKNPFPWPVTIKYRGLTVLRRKDKTRVIFPDGQTISVNHPNPCVVALK